MRAPFAIALNLTQVMRSFIFLFFFLFAHDSRAQAQKMRVVALEGLPLHAAPSGDSDVLAVVPFSAEVVGEADVHEREVLDGLTGFWVAVFHEGKSGFAFSAHLLPAIRPISEWELKGSKDCIILPRSRPHEAV